MGLIKVNAQSKGDVELGLGLGLSLATVSTSNGESTSSRVTYNAVASGEYYFSDRWGVKAKLTYDNKGWKDGFIIDQDFNSFTTDFELSYITLPVMANWHFGSQRNWYLNFGPYVGFLTTAEDSELGMDLTEVFNTTDVGLAYGVGYKFRVADNIKLFAEVDGQSGFVSVFKKTEGETLRNSRASLNFGVLFDL